MSRVRSTDTMPEVLLRSLLHKAGFRFQKNVKELPGKPDVVLPKYKAVIFIHGCFWHGHLDCKKAELPATRTEFWKTKIEGNIQRDKKSIQLLQEQDWRIAVIWECALKNKLVLSETSEGLISWLKTDDLYLEIPESLEKG